jgi:hypothetical protein
MPGRRKPHAPHVLRDAGHGPLVAPAAEAGVAAAIPNRAHLPIGNTGTGRGVTRGRPGWRRTRGGRWIGATRPSGVAHLVVGGPAAGVTSAANWQAAAALCPGTVAGGGGWRGDERGRESWGCWGSRRSCSRGPRRGGSGVREVRSGVHSRIVTALEMLK